MFHQPVSPTEQEWRDLYQAADQLKQLAPWEWMLDSDLFGLRDPESGTIGYCCVMGNLGEHFALGVYLGDEGLRGYTRLQSGEFWPPDIGGLFIQDCLMASFEDRELLAKHDRDQIKALGLKYRGRNAWPLFRNYTPGYVPWYLSAPEARFLTCALEQTCVVARRFAEDPAILDPSPQGQLLVRVAEAGEWRDTWHTPHVAPPATLPPPRVDEVRLRRIKQLGLARGGVWETDRFYSPQAVQEERGDRPYYPMVCLFVDRASGMVLAPAIAGPEDWRRQYQGQLLSLIEQSRVLPREVLVRDQEVRALLAPIAEPLGTTLRVLPQLPAIDDAREELLAYMSQL